MIKKSLALAFLITGFLLVSNAYGEEDVYYCGEIDGNGFHYDEKNGSYERTVFSPTKFKMKLHRASNLIELVEDGTRRKIFTCKNPFPSHPKEMSCFESYYHFNFNPITGRFVYARIFGYVGGDNDSLSVSYGKCDKF